MSSAGRSKGNNPDLWQKLLDHLDEKLQLGLLTHLRKISSYHFEGEVLYIEPSSEQDAEYLSRETVLQHLQLLAQDAVKVEKVKVKAPSTTGTK